MYKHVRLSSQALKLLAQAKQEIFGVFNFIAMGTEIGYAVDAIASNWDNFSWEEIILKIREKARRETLPKRLNMRAEIDNKILSLCTRYDITYSEAVEAILSLVLDEQQPYKRKVQEMFARETEPVELYKCTLFQQNLDAQENKRERLIKLFNEIENVDADIIFLSEYAEDIHQSFKENLEKRYDFYYPSKFDKRDSHYKICILGIKKGQGIKFRQQDIPKVLQYRYIAGKIEMKMHREMYIFLAHVPQTAARVCKDKTYTAEEVRRILRYCQDRMEQKTEFFVQIDQFVRDHHKDGIFLGGDMNTETAGGKTSLENLFQYIYNMMEDSDQSKSATWERKRLDYALTRNLQCKTKHQITSSDHHGLFSIIKI